MRPSEQGQAVQRARLLDEAIESVVVLPSSSALDKQNDGRLVHVSGILQVGEPLTEMDYGIAMSAIKLKRRVQMYQWEEEQTNSGQQDETKESLYTNYYYTTNWKDKLISSSKFYVQTGHHNPRIKHMPLFDDHALLVSNATEDQIRNVMLEYSSVFCKPLGPANRLNIAAIPNTNWDECRSGTPRNTHCSTNVPRRTY
uniref:(California timema) hypothetical protein n=1 Tax=Timema californicum TaxID=61474 RepID=A0A7R9J0B0_TIMCA|nr:unnamed protein product [Timema californicum]